MIGTYPDDDLVCITTQGQAVKLAQQDVRQTGRSAAVGRAHSCGCATATPWSAWRAWCKEE